jgi:fimbrial protein
MYAALLILSGTARAFSGGDTVGNHGVLHVSGMMSDGACQVDMSSARQIVELGPVSSRHLFHPGDRGTAVAFQLHFRDCLTSGGDVTDSRTEVDVHDVLQPVVSVMFTGISDAENPALFRVEGASGMGLRLLDHQGRDVRADSPGAPEFLNSGNTQLTYYVIPERTGAPLVAGPFQATVNFRLNYD